MLSAKLNMKLGCAKSASFDQFLKVKTVVLISPTERRCRIPKRDVGDWRNKKNNDDKRLSKKREGVESPKGMWVNNDEKIIKRINSKKRLQKSLLSRQTKSPKGIEKMNLLQKRWCEESPKGMCGKEQIIIMMRKHQHVTRHPPIESWENPQKGHDGQVQS